MVPSSRARVDLPAPPEPMIKIFFTLDVHLPFQAQKVSIAHPNNRLQSNSIRRYNSTTTRIMPKLLIL